VIDEDQAAFSRSNYLTPFTCSNVVIRASCLLIWVKWLNYRSAKTIGTSATGASQPHWNSREAGGDLDANLNALNARSISGCLSK
jgi:hypothetical protein